jgi:outer membrane protein OmpA-like peptidoglycan-associated protein
MVDAAAPRYKAFISYSHAVDSQLAPAIQRALTRFARRWWAMRTFRVFRDESNLAANPSLWSGIELALSRSEYFILLLSNTSAASEWVARELGCWLQRNSPSHILLVSTDQRIVWNAESGSLQWADGLPLPSAFSRAFPNEPRYVDLGWARNANTDLSLENSRFRDAIADLASVLHGRPKDDLIGEEVLQHRKATRVRWASIAALTLLAAVSSGLAFTMYRLSLELQAQRDEAVRQRAEVLRTLEWAVSESVGFDFNRASLDPIAGNMLKGFVERLRRSGYHGSIVISAYAGRFCVLRKSQDEVMLPPAEMPARRCVLHDVSDAYSQRLAQRRAEAIKYFLVSNAIDMSTIVTVGALKTRFPYPDLTKVTAGEWNAVARMNNSIQIELVGVVGSRPGQASAKP